MWSLIDTLATIGLAGLGVAVVLFVLYWMLMAFWRIVGYIAD